MWSEYKEGLTWAGGLIFGSIVAGLGIRKRKSYDDAAIAGNNGTKAELEAAREDREQRIQDERTIGELMAKNQVLMHENANLQMQIKLYKRRIERLEAWLEAADPTFARFRSHDDEEDKE